MFDCLLNLLLRVNYSTDYEILCDDRFRTRDRSDRYSVWFLSREISKFTWTRDSRIFADKVISQLLVPNHKYQSIFSVSSLPFNLWIR